MCDLLTVMDSNIVQVALNGLDNVLKSGELQNIKPNPYAVLIEECGGKLQYFIYKINEGSIQFKGVRCGKIFLFNIHLEIKLDF